MSGLRDALGDKFRMVLDIKQAVRAGCSPYDFTDILADNICHVHISDYNGVSDCVPPGEGRFDFKKFFDTMKEKGYRGDYVIELYRSGFRDIGQLESSFNALRDFA